MPCRQKLFNIFGDSEDNYGIITHGGSTSIIKAMIAYVIPARAKKIKYPEIGVPEPISQYSNIIAALLVRTIHDRS